MRHGLGLSRAPCRTAIRPNFLRRTVHRPAFQKCARTRRPSRRSAPTPDDLLCSVGRRTATAVCQRSAVTSAPHCLSFPGNTAYPAAADETTVVLLGQFRECLVHSHRSARRHRDRAARSDTACRIAAAGGDGQFASSSRRCWRMPVVHLLPGVARQHFCGVCGRPTRPMRGGHVLRCTDPETPQCPLSATRPGHHRAGECG